MPVDLKLSMPKIQQGNKILLAKNANGSPAMDKTFAIEKDHVVDIGDIGCPAVIMVIDTGAAVKYITNKFFLQSIQKPKMERFQIVETFRESKLFFFGERTKVYTISGSFLEASNLDVLTAGEKSAITAKIAFEVNNYGETKYPWVPDTSYMYRWSTGFQDLYNRYLRGTMLAENDRIAVLSYDGFMIYGYPLQMQVVQDANVPYLVQFQMTWAILKEEQCGIPEKMRESTYSLEQGSGKDAAQLKKDAGELVKLQKEYERVSAVTDKIVTDFNTFKNNNNDWLAAPLETRIAKTAERDDAIAKEEYAYHKYVEKILGKP